MNRSPFVRALYLLLIIALSAAFLLSSPAGGRAAAGKSASDLSLPSDFMKLGERIYRDGILPDGEPLKGYVRGDVQIDSSVFSCTNCHARSGLGTIEGQIASPPVNGKTLFNARYQFKDQIKNEISRSKGVTRSAKPIRSAYTQEKLADAIRYGADPHGRELSPIMPRYMIEDRDMRILGAYLQNLSSTYSPGVTETALRFATIVTDDVSPEDRQALLAPLETLVTINRQTKTQRKLPQFAKMFRMLDNAYFREISIATWELKGAPETWRAQLQEYNDKEPVFAILGGISWQEWKPIHDFCEDNQIPCLFPITDLPVISETSWYTFYASKGYYQEGESAALFLSAETQKPSSGKILQILLPTKEGRALSSGFDHTLKAKGGREVETVELVSEKPLNGNELKTLVQKHRPTTVVLWGGADVVPLLEMVAGETGVSDIVVSARYLGDAVAAIPDTVRDKTYITYPYRMPEDEKVYQGYADALLLGKLKHKDQKRIASRTFSMVHMFLQGLKELKLDFYRDTLLDVISMRPDQYLPDFERYSFGPGQRYASKGCYIVQLGKGPAAPLIKKSDWVMF